MSGSFSWSEFIAQQIVGAQSESVRQFYEALPYHDSLMVQDTEFVALDFETTGLDPETDEIVSIGLVPFTLKRIKVAQAKHWLVRPSCHLKDDSIVIHGITHSDISTAPSLPQVLEQVLDHLQGKIVVVHYQFIEREFLNRAALERFGDELIFPMIDTMLLEGRVYRHGWRNKLRRLLGGRMTSIRLSDSRLRYALPRYHMHNAMSDAIATAELLQAQLHHRYSNTSFITDLCI